MRTSSCNRAMVSSTGFGRETGEKEGEVGLTVVEWGGGEVASPLL